MGTVTIRSYQGDVLVNGDTREGEGWQEAATRLYNSGRKGGKRHMALCNSFPGGGTSHVQFGRRVGNSTSLDETVIIQVRDAE